MSQPNEPIIEPIIFRNIEEIKEYKPLESTEKIKKYIKNLSNIDGADDLKRQLTVYKERLKSLIYTVDPLLDDARTQIPKLNLEKYLKSIFIKPFFSNYKKKLDEISWNKDRIKNIDIDNQEQNYIYGENDNTIDNFRKQLLLLFSPFLTDGNIFDVNSESELNGKLEEEIKKSNKLIDLAKDFRKYIMEKRDEINNITSINYRIEDIKYINNTNNEIEENNFIQKLTEDQIDNDDKLDTNILNKFIGFIETSINSLDVIKEVDKLKEPVIFKNEITTEAIFKEILNLDSVVKIEGLNYTSENLSTNPAVTGISATKSSSSKSSSSKSSSNKPFISSSNKPSISSSNKPKRLQKQGPKQLKKVKKVKSNLKGGTIEKINDIEKDNPYIISDNTNKLLVDLLKNLNILQETFSTLIEDAEYLQQLQIRYNNYIHYIFSIIQRLLSKDKDVSDILEFYTYLNKNIINEYILKLNSIKSQINKNDVKMKFLNEYHYITIDKILSCLNYISKNFPNENYLVDINNCTGEIKNDLYVFNHFRKVIDSIE